MARRSGPMWSVGWSSYHTFVATRNNLHWSDVAQAFLQTIYLVQEREAGVGGAGGIGRLECGTDNYCFY